MAGAARADHVHHRLARSARVAEIGANDVRDERGVRPSRTSPPAPPSPRRPPGWHAAEAAPVGHVVRRQDEEEDVRVERDGEERGRRPPDPPRQVAEHVRLTLPDARRSAQASLGLAEVLPAGKPGRLTVEAQLDAFALLAPADHREVERVRRRGEQLVVLAEAEVGRARPPSGTASRSTHSRTPERRARWPASTARPSETSSIAVATRPRRRPSSSRSGGRRCAVDVRVVEPARRQRAEAGPGAAERPGDDEQVARAGAGTTGNAVRAADRRHARAAPGLRGSCRRRAPARPSRRCPRTARRPSSSGVSAGRCRA